MIEFNVKLASGDNFEVSATSRDLLMWEKTTKGASLKTLMDDPKMVDMYKLAHFAARRASFFTGTLAEFEEQAELEFEVPDEPDPTQ